jgi:hypothetical protein
MRTNENAVLPVTLLELLWSQRPDGGRGEAGEEAALADHAPEGDEAEKGFQFREIAASGPCDKSPRVLCP